MEKVNARLYSWASDIDSGTILQAEKASRLPIVEGHVALMPDAHVGMGATVGSVIPTKGAIIPSAVGVDIGCGMIASRINVDASKLPDDLNRLLPKIEAAVPAGVGKGHDAPVNGFDIWDRSRSGVTLRDLPLSPKQRETAAKQFGTLGSGNHFFEICLDEADQVWIVLHSGSRGIGNQLASGHIKKARDLAKHLALGLEDPDLAYFVQGTPEFEEYMRDLFWAQAYAMGNRQQMMHAATKVVLKALPAGARVVDTINCHHNYTSLEKYDDMELFITRKGAIKADVGDRGVIPGSMGTRSYIVSGLGNPLSWNSCSHGAGRRMSRGEARRTFTSTDLKKAMEGKAWLADRASELVDEIPASYKDIDQVMEDQKDLVRVEHILHQVLNYKGT